MGRRAALENALRNQTDELRATLRALASREARMAAQDAAVSRLQAEAMATSERLAALRMRNEQLERLAAASTAKGEKIKHGAARLAAAETQLRETRAQVCDCTL